VSGITGCGQVMTRLLSGCDQLVAKLSCPEIAIQWLTKN